jgi:hypothetical protein
MKVRDLEVRGKIADKHKYTLRMLFLISYILLLPFALLSYLVEFAEKLNNLCNEVNYFRSKVVYTIFKIIYKKEIIAEMKKEKREE